MKNAPQRAGGYGPPVALHQFGQIYLAYHKTLIAISRRHGLNQQDAEDVAQDALQILFRAIVRASKPIGESYVKAWLITVTLRLVSATHQRRLATADEQVETLSGGAPTADELLYARSLEAQVLSQVERRPRIDQIILTNLLLGSATDEEVLSQARDEGIPVSPSNLRCRRKRLRAFIERWLSSLDVSSPIVAGSD